MKTNQIMIRPMGDFTVSQRTKDGFFNSTELLRQWNENTGQKKSINHYLDNGSTKEFIQALIDDDEKIRNSEKPINQVIIKQKAKTNKDGNREAGATWMSPLLFIDFAMWLNPVFKVKVLKFVRDEMIKFRNLAGDAYPAMCKAVRSILGERLFKEKISDLARSLNIIVYGKHETLMRNKVGDEGKITELYELERQVAQWIELGLVQDYDTLRKALLRMYYKKHPDVLPI